MVSTVPAFKNIPTDTWVQATWTEYILLVDSATYEKARCYYDSGEMRIEMAPLGSGHARENAILSKWSVYLQHFFYSTF